MRLREKLLIAIIITQCAIAMGKLSRVLHPNCFVLALEPSHGSKFEKAWLRLANALNVTQRYLRVHVTNFC